MDRAGTVSIGGRATALAIPAELLLDVFRLAGLDPLTCSAVCRFWRRTALCTRSLWAAITIYDSSPSRSLSRAHYFVELAGEQLLSITRHALARDTINVDGPGIIALDAFVERCLPRSKSLVYSRIRARSKSELFEHFLTVFLSPALHLETLQFQSEILLELREDDPFGETASIDMQANFPRLRVLTLHGVCMPFNRLQWSGPDPVLESLEIESICEESPDHFTCGYDHNMSMGEQIEPLLRNCRALQNLNLTLYLDAIDEFEPEVSRLDLHSVLHPSLRSVHITEIGLGWPSCAALSTVPFNLPALTTLDLWGSRTQPVPTAHTLDARNCSPMDPVLELFAAAPNLQDASFYDWTRVPCQHATARPCRTVLLPHLRRLDMNDCSHNVTKAFRSALVTPMLGYIQDVYNGGLSASPSIESLDLLDDTAA
ncbi:hypothetical protein EXIGLDRAFT_699749 [Exidia glandulosa HHB12029]|uniref:F-box domain-containing protein n=1 Tax=Exidia glandulosa HHB12029 TaxID=1314781 RepID=A0A165DQU3_EXIGL|nr:hypothetical protein EXIGLDRAFT_699749 [Exidia glandulosa HHB12029]